jgi:hypothetical protein
MRSGWGAVRGGGMRNLVEAQPGPYPCEGLGLLDECGADLVDSLEIISPVSTVSAARWNGRHLGGLALGGQFSLAMAPEGKPTAGDSASLGPLLREPIPGWPGDCRSPLVDHSPKN